ncbi:MAG: rRNA maturation RNase YbeY [Bacilli bacterium]|nr:rRNA maturation RNase YbeY [Bacilli bacterium]
MNLIEVFNETNNNLHKEALEVKELMEYAANYLEENNLEFNIIFVNNEEIRRLNREYRNIDNYTDVLSFALEDYEDIQYEDMRLLGDIYISIDQTSKQAEENNHSFLKELSFLSIHGLLHLLGYDHSNTDEEKIMFEKQEAILNEYGRKK